MNDSKMRKILADDKEFSLIGRLHNLLKIQKMNKVSTLETVVSVRETLTVESRVFFSSLSGDNFQTRD